MSKGNPFKSVISMGNVDDTALALPSVNQSRTAQQRVLEQVQSMKRTKSRISSSSSRSGSTLSPTSPSYDSVFEETQKSPQSTSNGIIFFKNGFSRSLSQEKNSVQHAKVSSVNRYAASSQYKRHYAPAGPLGAGRGNTSRSNPDLPSHLRSVPPRSGQSNRIQTMKGVAHSSQKVTNQFIMSTTAPAPPPPLNAANGHLKSSNQFIMNTTAPAPPPPLNAANGHLKSSNQFITNTTALAPPPPLNAVNGQIKSSNQFIMNTTAPAPPPPLNAANGQIKSSNQFICSRIDSIKVPKPAVTETTSKSKTVDSGSNGNAKIADITMKEAVDYLSSSEETYQHCGASYIQHNTFIDNTAKEEVLKLNGISPLVNLLRSSSLQVNSTASAALRNLSYKNDKVKEEIRRCGGITQVADLLRESDSLELQKQLTGLLWNLSCVDSLKPELLKSALGVLVDRVIVPYTTGFNQDPNDSKNPEVFLHTTGCLKNLSCSKQNYRQTMRKCQNLIDCLAKYIKDCVAAGKPDNVSVENCVCVLHNLTFQLEAEAPDLFSRINALGKNMSRSKSQDNISPVGCFSTHSKPPEPQGHFDFPVIEDPKPAGIRWLIHSETLRSYLSLLGSSQRQETQEACCGALQNLTTHDGIVSAVMGQAIVQKLSGLEVISPLLNSNKVNLQRNTVALVGNLTKNPVLHNAISLKGLPELLEILSNGIKGGNESDDTLAMACQASSCMLMKNPEINKNLLNKKLIDSLSELSKNIYFPKSKKAAALLLFKLWSDKDLQSFLKKQGMNKSSFVNDITIAARQSL